MKILFVMEQFDNETNGTTTSATRIVDALRRRGHKVTVVAIGKPAPDKFCVKERYVLLASNFAHAQGFIFADPNEAVLTEAIKQADIVHFYTPFALCIKGLKIAQKLGVPYTAAYHIQAENVTYNIGLWWFQPAADFVYWFFRNRFFKKVTHIHCPSEFIAGELKAHKYQAKMHVISNGVDPIFQYRKIEKPTYLQGKKCILMIGRLSREKRQDLIIQAIEKSKYRNDIQLILAGNGPEKNKYQKKGKKLPNPPIFGFYTKNELYNLISYCDLYIHSAEIEIEAIACIEALSAGLVPIISNGIKSATKQFALDERSLYTQGDTDELATKIDYWFDNEEERKKMELLYSQHAVKYNINNTAKQLEDLFSEAIADHKT